MLKGDGWMTNTETILTIAALDVGMASLIGVDIWNAINGHDTLLTAAKAVGKQVPMKPAFDTCPICDTLVKYHVVTEGELRAFEVTDNFCGNCGQAIDWSKE